MPTNQIFVQPVQVVLNTQPANRIHAQPVQVVLGTRPLVRAYTQAVQVLRSTADAAVVASQRRARVMVLFG